MKMLEPVVRPAPLPLVSPPKISKVMVIQVNSAIRAEIPNLHGIGFGAGGSVAVGLAVTADGANLAGALIQI